MRLTRIFFNINATHIPCSQRVIRPPASLLCHRIIKDGVNFWGKVKYKQLFLKKFKNKAKIMEETLSERGKSAAATVIFILVFSFHFVSKYLESYKKKKGSKSEVDVQLRAEIKMLLKEAGSLSQPSTFAQAAKLRRMAAAKEKELAKNQELHNKDTKSSFDTYGKFLMISKVLTYVVLILWFWGMPVATISDQLVQPFGKALSWRAGGSLKDNVMVGIIPWLILSTRVSKFICRKVLK